MIPSTRFSHEYRASSVRNVIVMRTRYRSGLRRPYPFRRTQMRTPSSESRYPPGFRRAETQVIWDGVSAPDLRVQAIACVEGPAEPATNALARCDSVAAAQVDALASFADTTASAGDSDVNCTAASNRWTSAPAPGSSDTATHLGNVARECQRDQFDRLG